VTIGGQIDQSWKHTLFAQPSDTTIGLQLRHDDIRNGLYHTQETNRIGTTRSDHTRETSVGIFAQNETRWTPWFRTVAGVRGDWFHFDVENGTGANSGNDDAFIASPKLSLIFGPWKKTEFYVNGGFGFHSNDARGVPARTDAADPLVRTKGAEVGIRTTIIPGLQTSLSAWMLDIDSELLFVGDAGTTEAGRPSRRTGIELANFWKPTDWLTVDADLAISRSRFRDDAPEGRNIPGSIKTVASVGISIHDVGPWFGSLRYRYFGPRELIEDGTRQSTGSTLLYAQIGYKINATWSVTADVFNVLNAEVSDIDYYYTSRQRGEPAAGVDDYHSHPAEPRSLRVTLTAKW
jgi:outer membrane receptor protein involved in Fe transport